MDSRLKVEHKATDDARSVASIDCPLRDIRLRLGVSVGTTLRGFENGVGTGNISVSMSS